MVFDDNREFIKALEKTGDVVRVKQEVDWDLQAGAISRRACELKAPAPLFEKIKGYPPGYRLLFNPLATHRRLAASFGLPVEAGVREIQQEYERRIEKPIKPVIVKSGPCKENTLEGDKVDLLHFPVPMIHEGDGGRYIGTWHLVIARDPDTGWTNWGMYRMMAYNRRFTGGGWHRQNHHGRLFYGKYAPRNMPMPVAVAIGADPLSSLIASAPVRAGEDEADYAGALRQKPVELIKCDTCDILVPAQSEIILEGVINPGAWVTEGPFGEFPGYRVPERSVTPAFEVKHITFRKDPILTGSCLGILADDGSVASSLTGAVALKKRLKDWGIPVTDVYVPPEAASLLVVVGVKALYANVATQVKNIIHSRWQWWNKVIIVEDDVDVFNMGEVLHAFATKCHPVRGITVSDKDVALTLTPFLSPEERKWAKGAAVAFDCTWPVDWPRDTAVPRRMSFNEVYPEEVKAQVLKEWKEYGF